VLTRARRGGDSGFTLIELLVAVVVLGIIVVPLVNVVIGYLHSADATTARLSESHDVQMATAYFAQDVQAAGVRDYTVTSTAYFPLKQSIETGVAAAAGGYPCGAAGLPPAVVRFAWDDFSAGAGSAATQTRVAYVVENGNELHRVVCAGSATPASDVRIAQNLIAPYAVVSCADRSGTAVACTGTGTAVPASASLTLTLRDARSAAGTPYTVTLTGQRRQS
jgi:prepilin-type N-terminal cleavage/methylation domain-containing protein